MGFSLKSVFRRAARHDGVRWINVYLLRLLYVLMFFVLGKETWTHLLTHKGPDRCGGVVLVDGVCDFGGHWNYSSGENDTDGAAGDILQSAVAHSGGLSSLAKGSVVGFASGRHRLGVLVVAIADRCGSVGLCVCDLLLQTKETAGGPQPLGKQQGRLSRTAEFVCWGECDATYLYTPKGVEKTAAAVT